MKAGRIPCLVPGCDRTSPDHTKDGTPIIETICGKHFRMADKHQIARYRKLWHIVERRAGYPIAERAHGLAGEVWQTIRKQAIERAMGITA